MIVIYLVTNSAKKWPAVKSFKKQSKPIAHNVYLFSFGNDIKSTVKNPNMPFIINLLAKSLTNG